MVSKQKSSILYDMAKVAIKYDNIVPYGEFFYVMNEFNIPNEVRGLYGGV